MTASAPRTRLEAVECLRVAGSLAVIVIHAAPFNRAGQLGLAWNAATVANQLARFADVTEDALLAAVDASVESLKQQLLQKHRRIQNSVRAKVRIQQQLDNEPGKFCIRKMATGSIDDFHDGLQGRIGE